MSWEATKELILLRWMMGGDASGRRKVFESDTDIFILRALTECWYLAFFCDLVSWYWATYSGGLLRFSDEWDEWGWAEADFLRMLSVDPLSPRESSGCKRFQIRSKKIFCEPKGARHYVCRNILHNDEISSKNASYKGGSRLIKVYTPYAYLFILVSLVQHIDRVCHPTWSLGTLD